MKFGLFGVGELELHSLHRLMKVVAEVFVNQRNQCFNLFRLQRAEASALQNLHYVGGSQNRQVMPALEIGIDPCGYRGQKFVKRASKRIGSERGGDELAYDPGVEGI